MWPLFDFETIMRAARALLAGQNPYRAGSGTDRFFNPPWALLFAIPLIGIRSNEAVFAVVVGALVLIIIFTSLRLSRSPLSALTASLGAGTFGALAYGNLDPLVWLGLLTPLPLGIALLAIKPQATALVIIVLLLKRLEQKGLMSCVIAILPTAMLTAVWLLAFGLPDWNMSGNGGNIGIWPYGLIVGLPLAALAVWRRSIRLAMFCGPLCTPYLSVNSFLGMSYAYPLAGLIVGWLRVWMLL